MSELTYSSQLRCIRFSGDDAAGFLQGYLTIDTSELATDAWALAALCNIKGRVVASGWARAHEVGVDWIVHSETADRVVEFLTPYLRFSKSDAQVLDTPIGWLWADGFEFGFLEHAGTDSTEQLLNQLFATRTVLVDAGSTEQYLPQMLGLTQAGAVSFSKGCYLGQEVVARAEHRGAVKRALAVAEGEFNPDEVVLRAQDGTLIVSRQAN